jgi:FAD/FMN-containing dehydrogenase
MCGLVWCYNGPPQQANEILEPLRAFRQPAFELFAPMPFPMLQRMFDHLYRAGLQWYWKADIVNELGDDAIALHIDHGSALPTLHSTMHLYPINGAVHKTANDGTPWSFRDAVWCAVIVGVDPNPANKDRIVEWAQRYWEALRPYGAGGAYVNFMMDDEGDARVRASYGDNYERLARIKANYDPENFFRVNQNIRPAQSWSASQQGRTE